MISLTDIYFSYVTPEGKAPALNGITVSLTKNITAVVGRTGSGKSTLAEIIGGITKPDSGTVTIDGAPPDPHSHNIGFLFQYPEHQLFADTVYDDIAYAPRLAGLDGDALNRRVIEAAERACLAPEFLQLSPFLLSGGQKRLAALAGVLASEPSLLLLDEPAAGLDPAAKKLLFSIVRSLVKEKNVKALFVTHSMDDAARYTEDILVLGSGTVKAHGAPEEIFAEPKVLDECGLDIPETLKLKRELLRFGIETGDMLTEQSAFLSLDTLFKEHGIKAKGASEHAS